MQSSYFFFSFFMEQWVLVCIYLGGYIFSIINPPFYMTISNWARLPFFQFFFFLYMKQKSHNSSNLVTCSFPSRVQLWKNIVYFACPKELQYIWRYWCAICTTTLTFLVSTSLKLLYIILYLSSSEWFIFFKWYLDMHLMTGTIDLCSLTMWILALEM